MREDIDRYAARRRTEAWTEASAGVFSRHLHAMARFLARRGCRRLPDVAPADLDAYLQHLLDQGRAASSRVQIAHAIVQFFRAMQEEGRIVTCPARALAMPSLGEAELPEPPLTEDAVAALFAALPRRSAIDLRNVALLELLYGCGLRRAEAIALDCDAVDLVRRTIHVRAGKGLQQRLLPLMSTALAAVKDYLAVRRTLLRGPDTGALLLSQRTGRRLDTSSVDQWFAKLNRERGPRTRSLHPHLFRHSIAVHMLRRGADIRHIQAFLGHADLNTTKIYLRLVPGDLREDYDDAMPEIEVGLATGSQPTTPKPTEPGQ